MKIKKVKAKNLDIMRALSLSAIAVMIVVASIYAPSAKSATLQQQIDALNADNSKKNDNKNQLGAEAVGISATITKLQAEINAVQAKISANEAEMARLQGEIKVAEAELERQKDLLGQTIRAMYVEGEITTVEMLATSKDLSDFFDKQQYRESVRSKIKTTLDKITALKLELNKQRDIVAKLLAEQKTLQNQLASQKAENNRLLSMNQSQQGALDAQMRANSGKIAELRKQQEAANARFRGGGRSIPDTSGYPWANYRAGAWSHAGSCYYGDDIDPWGLCYRQCVSYAAWKTWKTKGYMPYGFGDAKNWDDRARARGIPVDGNPRAGDIAVSNNGTWGHVMYVESVNPNGTINISQYNVSLTGTYSVATVSAGGLSFIHF
jgi:surface antigen/peptidoglycan hydrolase CwlO-like protein